MKNLQISIDGPPGSGKTTLAALLSILLERCGSGVEVADPSASAFAEARAALVQNPEGTAPQFNVSIQVRNLQTKTTARKKVSNPGVSSLDFGVEEALGGRTPTRYP